MSWNGTVRCSHCYTKGHNRRSCPTITERMLERYKAAKIVNDDDPDYIAGRRAEYVKRTGLDPDTGKKVKRKEAKAERMKNVRCGYCQTTGHTRRTCLPLTQDFAVFKHLSSIVRAERKQQLEDLGLGIGSLFPVSDYGYNPEGEYGMRESLRLVTGLQVELITADVPDPRLIILKDACNLGPRGDVSAVSVLAFKDIHQNRPEHVSMTGSKGISFPEGWDTCADISIKDAFPVKNERPYSYRHYPSDEIKAARAELGIEEAEETTY